MIDKPAPLVPANIDLSGLGGFMLRADKLLSSELVALGTPEECWAAVLLWCRAWQQKPAASLPNDDRVLASFSGSGKRWSRIKPMAMRGFVLCSDDRWYHKTLAIEAIEAWQRRLVFRERSQKAARASSAARSSGQAELEGMLQADLQADLEGPEGKGREGKGREGTGKTNGHDVLQEAFALPAWIDPNMWARFEESRKKARHPDLTEYGKSLIVTRLEKYRAAGDDPNQCLAEACEFGYRAPFPVKNKQHATNRADAAAAVREQAKREIFGTEKKS